MLFGRKKTPKGIKNVKVVAEELGISERTLWRRINDYDIPVTPKGTYIAEEDVKRLAEIQEKYETGE